jgi:hypothetical protein
MSKVMEAAAGTADKLEVEEIAWTSSDAHQCETELQFHLDRMFGRS